MATISFKGLLATESVSYNGVKFSKEALEQVCSNDQKQVPVRLNFHGDPIGYTTKIEKTEDGLVVSFEIDEGKLDFMLDFMGQFVDPGFVVKSGDFHEDENGIKVIDKMTLTEVSICYIPADSSLTPIIKKGEKHNER